MPNAVRGTPSRTHHAYVIHNAAAYPSLFSDITKHVWDIRITYFCVAFVHLGTVYIYIFMYVLLP
jgi:hypothetical protein